MKIDQYYQQQKCRPVTLVSGNIRSMRIFTGVPRREDVKRQWVIENVDFQGFRTLRLQRLRKWGQHYYIVLFSPFSPLHLTPKYMTFNGHFTFNFPLLWTAFQLLGYIFVVENIFVVWRHYRDLRNIADPRKDCGSFVDEKLRVLHRRNLNK